MNKNGYFQSDKDGNVTKAPPKKQPPPFSSVSWNDLTDKPFGESATGGDTLTWDGNTEGLVSIELASVAYNISDKTPTIEDFANGYIISIDGAGGREYSGDSLLVLAEGAFAFGDHLFYCISQEAADASGLPGMKAGIYAAEILAGILSFLTIPGYKGFPSLKPVPDKYLPGAIVYYVNATEKSESGDFLNYLYNSADVSNPQNRTTREQLRAAVLSGQKIVVQTPGYYEKDVGFYLPSVAFFGQHDAHASLGAYDGGDMPVSWYTAEVTP